MKRLVLWTLLLAGLTFLPVSCEKIDLPTEDTEQDEEEVSDEETSDEEVSVESDTLSVAQAQEAYGQVVGVMGYIVGYVSGTSLSGAVFGVPTERANTNMLIADSPWETDVANCMPILLEADEVRPALNLYDHPDYYTRLVYIEGYVETYFTVAGIREVYAYEIKEEEDEPILSGDITSPVVNPDMQHVVSGRAKSVWK